MIYRHLLNLTLIHKSKVGQLVMLNFLIPPLELALLGLVFLILTASKVPQIPEFFNDYITIVPSLIQYILILAVLTFALVLFWAFLRLYRTRIQAITRYNIYSDQANQVSKAYFNISGDAELSEKNEEVANLIIHLSGGASALYMAWIGCLSAVFGVIILATTVLLNSFALAIIASIIGLFSVFINFKNFSQMESIGQTKIATHEQVLFEVNQNIRSFQLIKFDNLISHITNKLKLVIQKDWQWRVDKRRAVEKIKVLSDSFGILSLLIIVTASSIFLKIPAEQLVILLLIFNRLRSYFSEAQTHWVNIRENKPATIELLSCLSRFMKYSTIDNAAISNLHRIELKNVGFSYSNTPIINSVSTLITKGDRILLKGPSGEGKSTLLKLIAGYYKPTTGQIIFNNLQKQKPDIQSIVGGIFYSANDMYMPNIPLREIVDPLNVLTQNQLEKILKNVCLYDLLNEPNILNASVGDNGSYLSLGQRQRLLLSRIYLMEPSMVILDEATSNLDSDTENEVLKNLMDHAGEEAIIIFASHHAPSHFTFNKAFTVSSGTVIQDKITSKRSQ